MTKRLLPIIFLFCTISMCMCGQTIKGHVEDNLRSPLQFIDISLLSNKDSIFLGGTVTNESGDFIINPNQLEESLDIKFHGLGFATKTVHLRISSQDTINIGTVTLNSTTQNLDEVIVTGKRRMEYKGGQYKLTVTGTDLEKLPNIYSVLSFLPFVTVNGENLSVIGKGRLMIELNGREVKDMSLINTLLPSQIKDIIIIPHAPSSYDSQYDAVIKIKTITNIKDIASAQIGHSTIISRRYSDRQYANINFKKGKFTAFVSYQFRDNHSKDMATNQYFVYTEIGSERLRNSSDNAATSSLRSHKIILNPSLTIDSHNLLDIQYIASFDRDKNIMQTNETSSCSLLSNINTRSHSYTQGNGHNIQAKYQYFGSNSYATINVGYINYEARQGCDIMSGSEQFSNITGHNRYSVYTLKFDYNLSFAHYWHMLAGVRYSYVKNIGTSDSHSINQNALSYTNGTHLKDKTLGSYIDMSYSSKKLNVSFGIRPEITSQKYEWNTAGYMSRHSLGIYPSLDLSWNVSPSLIFDFGYSVKSSLPSFKNLSPLLRYINTHLYEEGNSELKKMVSHNIFLATVIHNKIVLECDYFYKRHIPVYIFQEMKGHDGILINSPINLDASYLELRLNYSDKFGFYRFAYNGLLHYDTNKTPFILNNVNSNKPELYLSTVNQFDITRRLMLFCNFDMSSSYRSLGTYVHQSFRLSAGIYCSLLKAKQLTIILSVNDILHNNVPNSNTQLYNVKSIRHLSQDTRNVNLTIRYNINNFKTTFKKNNSNEAEVKRIN